MQFTNVPIRLECVFMANLPSQSMFVSKAKSLGPREPFRFSFRVASIITCTLKTRPERLAVKQTLKLIKNVNNYSYKRFYDFGPCSYIFDEGLTGPTQKHCTFVENARLG
jgi:hypothetical protein